MSLLIIILVAVGAVLALLGVFRPFLGLCILVLIHFVQPGEMIPALNAMRLELVYGVLVLGRLLLSTLSSQGPSLFSDKVIRALFCFAFVAALTIPGSIWIGGAVTHWLNLLKLIVFVILMKKVIETSQQLRSMLWLQVIIMAWFAGSGLLAFANGDAYTVHYEWGTLDRAQGVNSIAGGPNELAGLLVALFPYLIALFQVVKNLLLRIPLIVIAVVAIAMIVLAGSRIGMISLLGIVLFYIVRSKNKLVTLIAAVAIALCVWNLMPAKYQARYLTVESYAEGGKLDASNELRLQIWRAGERMLLDHPILGVGIGQFPTAYGLKYSGVSHGGWMNPHNLLLQVGCETGLLGLFVFGRFILSIYRTNRALLKKRGPGTEVVQQVAIACSATLLAVIGISLVGHTMLRPYWYFLAGLVVANTSVAKRLESELFEEPQAFPNFGPGSIKVFSATENSGTRSTPASALI